jgi:hypothetical protein
MKRPIMGRGSWKNAGGECTMVTYTICPACGKAYLKNGVPILKTVPACAEITLGDRLTEICGECFKAAQSKKIWVKIGLGGVVFRMPYGKGAAGE